MTPRLLPEPGVVHVWQASLAVDDATLDRLRQSLAPAEEGRSRRLIDPRTRRRFVAGRGIAREILSSYLGISPGALCFGTHPGGKPFLLGIDGRCDTIATTECTRPHVPSLSREGTGWGWGDLRFNLSHSGDLFLLAIAVGQEIGIDVEVVRDDLTFAPLARTCFSAAECDALFRLPSEQQRAAFYRCWTRKEAYLKGVGTGFAQSCNLFDVTLLPGVPAALVDHRVHPDDVSTWRLHDLAPPSGCCAALAVAGQYVSVVYFASE